MNIRVIKNLKTFLLLVALSSPVFSQTNKDSVAKSIVKTAKIDGVIKTKFETSTEVGAMRFNVRNSRVGVRGEIGEYLGYRVQVEFSNEGVFSPLDMFGTLKFTKNFSFLIGQQLVPFENVFIITPAEAMFANRAFIGKYFTPGTRDIGAVAQYRFNIGGFPMEGQVGTFNGGRVNNPQWTSRPSFACRLIAGKMDGFRSTVKMYRYNRETLNDELELFLWGADVHYANSRLRVEAEVMNRRSYTTGLDLLGTYVQGAYTFDLHKANMFRNMTPAVRWDAMGYNVGSEGFDIKRITSGISFGLTFIPYDSLLRINYEHYFIRNGIVDFPDFRNRDRHVADNKVTVELLLRF